MGWGSLAPVLPANAPIARGWRPDHHIEEEVFSAGDVKVHRAGRDRLAGGIPLRLLSRQVGDRAFDYLVSAPYLLAQQ